MITDLHIFSWIHLFVYDIHHGVDSIQTCSSLECECPSVGSRDVLLRICVVNFLYLFLVRFYVVLSRGLQGDSRQVMASILLNSSELFKIDLPGISCIIPALLTALESILPDK